MAFIVKRDAANLAGLKGGGNPARQSNRTPPPDEVSRVRSPVAEGYGQPGPQNGPVQSVRPGQRVVSPLGANLESSVDDDGVLARIISGQHNKPNAKGVPDGDWQTRDLAPGAPPAHPHMKDRNIDSRAARVPDRLGFSESQPVRKPGGSS